MNEKVDLKKILKYCPKGTKFYSTIFGEVEFDKIKEDSNFPIIFVTTDGSNSDVTADGRYYDQWDGECTLFPSKDQRDWSKFEAPWYNKEKFVPETLHPFDKVLVRDASSQNWYCGLFSHIVVFNKICKYNVGKILYTMCIPYNDETKYLVGTTEEAPEYYRYWED